jgi:hypothetical protein
MTSDLGCFGFYCIYMANLRRSAVGRFLPLANVRFLAKIQPEPHTHWCSRLRLTPPFLPFLAFLPYSGFMCGNSSTSRIDGESVNSITMRSTPMPRPAVGGMPYSSART